MESWSEMTKYLTQWDFWQGVGLTVAARLSVVAVALWAVKIVTDHLARPVAVPRSVGKPAVALPRREIPTPSVARQQQARFVSFNEGAPQSAGRDNPAEVWRSKMGQYLAGKPVAGREVARR